MIMNADVRWKQRFNNYTDALSQLTESINLSKQRKLSNLEKEGTIQRFEYTHELSWKLLKDYLEYKGIKGMIGSRDAVRQAVCNGIIEKKHQIWMDMINERNNTSHTYNKNILDESLNRIIHLFYPELKVLLDKFTGYCEEN